MRSPIRIAVTAALLAPIFGALLLLVQDLRLRPTGRRAVERQDPPVVATLSPGQAITVGLRQDARPYRALVLHSALTGRVEALLQVCREARCDTVRVDADAQHALMAPLPAETRGGDVRIAILAIRGSVPPVPARGAAPQFDALQGFSWALPARSAGVVFARMAGCDWFGAALAATIAALAATLIASVGTGLARAPGATIRDPQPDGRGHQPS